MSENLLNKDKIKLKGQSKILGKKYFLNLEQLYIYIPMSLIGRSNQQRSGKIIKLAIFNRNK